MIALAVAERTGEISSSAVVIPSGGLWRVTIIGIPKTTDYLDPTCGLDMRFEWHDTAQWVERYGITWVGQVGGFTGRDGVNPDPWLQVNLDEMVAKQVRARIIIIGTVTFGVDVSQVT